MIEKILELKNILGDCKRVVTSTCLSKTSYETITLTEFFILDDITHEPNEPVRIVDNNSNFQLTVRNKTQSEICFIKTDKCLFTDIHKKCDCIVFGINKFFLIEISEARNRGRKRKDAVLQLGTTIELLRDRNIDLSVYDTKAIICFKNGETKPTQPSMNTKRAIFLEKYNVSLEEGNEISF